MDAYLVVEPPVRRKLEEMLQTWKQPVPGSTSSSPVFGQEVTRKIDNALIKARTAALNQQQKQMRQSQAALGLDRSLGRTPPPQQFRNTPPPPPNTHGYDGYHRSATGTPTAQQNGTAVGRHKNHSGGTQAYGYMSSQSVIGNSSAPGGLHQLSLQGGAPPQAGGIVDTLQSDIFRLIDSCQTAVKREPLNHELQKRLQALIDLRSILKTQQLPEAQLVLIRDQVRALANPTPPPPVMAPTPPPVPQMPPAQMPPAQMPLPMLSTQDLASLLATVPLPPPGSQPQMSLPAAFSLPPAPIMATPPPIQPPPPPAMPNFGNMDPATLFASLQKAGLLPNLPPPPPPPPAGPPLSFPLPLLHPRHTIPQQLQPASYRQQNQQSQNQNQSLQNTGNRAMDWRSIDVEMKSLSLKM